MIGPLVFIREVVDMFNDNPGLLRLFGKAFLPNGYGVEVTGEEGSAVVEVVTPEARMGLQELVEKVQGMERAKAELRGRIARGEQAMQGD